MKIQRRKQTIDENVSFFCKRNSIKLNSDQFNCIKECFLLYNDSFSSKSKLCEYLKYFIINDLKFWKQRLRRLSSINLKGVTKKKFLLLYGKTETLKRWSDYVKKQSKSNTYDYKKEKYGWSLDEFKKYNKSRSVTLENLVKKYGEIEGKKKYEDYVERQRYAGISLDYFTDKYGEVKGAKKYKDVCSSKALTLDNFVKKYGEIEGPKKYRNYYESKDTYYSKSSQELFWKIKTNNCYFAEYNKEFGLLSEFQYYFYDFVDTELKKCIEYNGDYWHCNPKIYSPEYKTHYGYTAKEIWEKDDQKLNFIKSKGYEVMVIWESDYLNHPDKVLDSIKRFLK